MNRTVLLAQAGPIYGNRMLPGDFIRNSLARLLTLCLVMLASATAAAQPAGTASPDRAAAAELARLINAYRASHGLAPIPHSPSLTAVAEAHVLDVASSGDGGAVFERGSDARGLPCNLHSWSARGPWRPVCYTGDHRYGALMWSKPREISRGTYAGNGYEIAAASSGLLTPQVALSSWQSSPAHNAVILEQGVWSRRPWRAMGVAVLRHRAFAWFGHEPDPAGR